MGKIVNSSQGLSIRNVSKRFNSNDEAALTDVSLEVESGTTMAVLGESGSGKTTLLRLLAGFDQPDSGTILMGEILVTDRRTAIPPEERRIGVVFQEIALFPHLNIYQNITFGLRRFEAEEREFHAQRILKLVRVQDIRKRYPHEVSGGQAQRAAIGRALAPGPELLLLDEPFNNLDPLLKGELLEELRNVLVKTKTTAVFVTHDRDEAFAVADNIAVLHEGKIEQIGTAESLYLSPVNDFIARYFGVTNLIPVTYENGHWVSFLGIIKKSIEPFKYGDGFAVSVRPSELEIAGLDSKNSDLVAATILSERFMGEFRELKVQVYNGLSEHPLIVHAKVGLKLKLGQSINIGYRSV